MHETGSLGLSQAVCTNAVLTVNACFIRNAGIMNALGKGCPAAICPHLSAAAQQVQGLWEADALRIGEYAVLAEGFVAAAAAAGDAALQSQVSSRVSHIMSSRVATV